MNQQLEEIRDQQKASWNKFSPGWKKWDDAIIDFMYNYSAEIIRLLNPSDGQLVLDIASGTGEPGLTMAPMLKGGKVIITDLADHMLDIAREKASAHGISNVEFQACDVTELPYEDNTFDLVSCRMGFMFFPDMLMAAKEVYRVLKPGGKFATAVWSVPEKNFWVTAMASTINRNMQLEPPPPEAPGMFRCAKPGLMTDIFKQAGFSNVSDIEIAGKLNCGNTDTYWSMMTEIAAPFVAALSKADEAMKAKIKNEVYEAVAQKFPDGNVNIDGAALIVYGEK